MKFPNALIIVLMLLLSPIVLADDAADSLIEQMDKAMRVPAEIVQAKFVITRPNGKVLERRLTLSSMTKGKDTATLLRFTAPADLDGTAFLTWNRNGRAERWIHIPGVGTRKIGNTDAREPFVGSDLTIEDLKFAVDTVNRVYRKVRDESCDGHPCVVIEDTPVDEKVARRSNYSKVLMWLDTDRSVVPRIEFYDKSGVMFKTMVSSKAEKVGERWRLGHSVITNLVKGSRTEMVVLQRQTPATMDETIFTVDNLGF